MGDTWNSSLIYIKKILKYQKTANLAGNPFIHPPSVIFLEGKGVTIWSCFPPSWQIYEDLTCLIFEVDIYQEINKIFDSVTLKLKVGL